MMQKFAVQIYDENSGDMIDVVLEADLDDRGDIYLKLHGIPDEAAWALDGPLVYLTSEVAESMASSLEGLAGQPPLGSMPTRDEVLD